MDKQKDPDLKQKQEEMIRIIHLLAIRLPWIAVIITLLSMVGIFIERLYFFSGP